MNEDSKIPKGVRLRIIALEALAKFVTEHPDARIVTDVGFSLFSGWGDLQLVIYHLKENVIELVFG